MLFQNKKSWVLLGLALSVIPRIALSNDAGLDEGLTYHLDPELNVPLFTELPTRYFRGHEIRVSVLKSTDGKPEALLVKGPPGFDLTTLLAQGELMDHMMLALQVDGGGEWRKLSIPKEDIDFLQWETHLTGSYLKTEKRPTKGRVFRMRNTEINLSFGLLDGQGTDRLMVLSNHGRAEGGFVTPPSKNGWSFCMLGGGKADIEYDQAHKSFMEIFGSVGLWPAVCWSRETPEQPFLMMGLRSDVRVGDHLDGNIAAVTGGLEAQYVDKHTRATLEFNSRLAGSDTGTSHEGSLTVLRVIKERWLVGATFEDQFIQYEDGTSMNRAGFRLKTGVVFTGKNR